MSIQETFKRFRCEPYKSHWALRSHSDEKKIAISSMAYYAALHGFRFTLQQHQGGGKYKVVVTFDKKGKRI